MTITKLAHLRRRASNKIFIYSFLVHNFVGYLLKSE